MKKRILSILLLCCMVLTMLPTAATFQDRRTAVHRPESQNFTSGTVCAPSSAAK